MLRQDGQLPDDLRQFAIARRVERKGELAIAGFFDLDDMAIIGGELRTVFFERVEGKDHVVGRHRLAVVPFCFSTQPIGCRGEIVRIADGFRDQAVLGGHFVQRRRQKRVVDVVDPGRQRAFDASNHDIEIVVGSDRNLPHGAAFRCRGVDVVELLEAGGIFQVAKQGKPVPPELILRLRRIGSKQERKPRGGDGDQSRG